MHPLRSSYGPIRRLAWFAGLILASAGPASGQGDEAAGGVGASVEAQLGVTRVAGVASGSAGFAALLHLRGGLRVGGGAWGILRRIDEGPTLAASGLDLGMGYGGAVVEVDLPHLPVAVRLLVGGGAATLRTLAVGTRFDAETFAVIEPGLTAGFRLVGPFSAGAVATYRWIQGADDLFLVSNEDLMGPQLSLYLRVGSRDD